MPTKGVRSPRTPLVPDVAAPLGWTTRTRLVGEVVAAYAAIRWALARHPLPAAVAIARRTRGPMPPPSAPSRDALIRLGHVVTRTLAVLPVDSRCLIRSLVLTRMLARRGVPSVIVLAARLQPEFSAHSWVEHDGVALLPAGAAFQRLTEL